MKKDKNQQQQQQQTDKSKKDKDKDSKSTSKDNKDSKSGSTTSNKKDTSTSSTTNVNQTPEKPKWTGKVPVQYLNEYCQKNHMEKPIFTEIKSLKPNSHRFRVTLAFEGKKRQITTKDYETSQSFPTVQEARSYTALTALFELCPNTTIYKLFPPEFTTYWMQLEKESKEEQVKKKIVQDEEQKEFEKQQLEKEAMKNAHTQVTPMVHMSEEAMNIVHQLVLQLSNSNSNINSNSNSNRLLDEKEKEILSGSLLELGFKKDDIQNALKNSNNNNGEIININQLIDWMCLNVPNENLPVSFKPKSIGKLSKSTTPTPTTTTNNDNNDNFNKIFEYSIKEYQKLGWSIQEINSTIQLLNNDDKEITTTSEMEIFFKLYYKLLSIEDINNSNNDIDKEEIKETKENELLALQSIYSDDSSNNTLVIISNQHYQYKLKDLKMEINIYFPDWCLYPHQLPVIIVNHQSSSTSTSTIIKELVKECQSNLSSPMVFNIINWCESNISTLLNQSSTTSNNNNTISTATTTTQINFKNLSIQNNKSPTTNNNNIKKVKKPILTKDELNRINYTLLEQYKVNNSKNESIKKQRESLPVHKKKIEFLEALSKSQVLVITAETGCGKSTQIPQYILESFVSSGNGSNCNIVCTQPRRISAIGVAERVSFEWNGGDNKQIGQMVGYQIRNESKRSSHTRLLFCTTGILLRRILDPSGLDGVSHVIVDEVHERSLDSDFLLIILKEMLKIRKDLKIILMSATLNANQISNYFGSAGTGVFSIPGFTFPVKNFYLEDCLKMINFTIPKTNPTTSTTTTTTTTTTTSEIMLKEKLDYLNIGMDQKRINVDLLEKIIIHLVGYQVKKGKSILVFLPGLSDILDICNRLEENEMFGSRIWAVPLHSSLSPKDQQKVFEKAPSGKTKVVVSTNVAETSITIDDVEIVVDSGRVNQMVYNPLTRNSVMAETWTSRASTRQRAGRAGRTDSGICYKIFTRDMESQLAEQDTPEILRTSLQQLCLHVRLFLSNTSDSLTISEFLSKAIDPPSPDQVKSSIDELVTINALDDTPKQSLTPMGYHLASLPVDVYIGKMLLFGCAFRCLDPILTIAATLSYKTPFLNPPDKKLRPHQKFAVDQSDHLTLVNTYNAWRKSISNGNEFQFCKENYLSISTLRTIQDLKLQFIEILSDIGFLPSGITSKQLIKYQMTNKGSEGIDEVCGYIHNSNSTKTKILIAVICAGMYPKVARIDIPMITYTKTASGSVQNKFQPDELLIQTNNTNINTLEKVFIHPRSINYKEGDYTYPFVLYHDKIETSRLFLHNITTVSPITLLMFSMGGKIEIDPSYQFVTLDGWLKCKTSSGKINILLKEIRFLFEYVLQQKIDNPQFDTSTSIIIDIVSKLVLSEGYL
eukprot:gene4729-5903_t